MKQLLFSITKNDFKVESFCAGGPGGQHQNKTASAVRITHLESGAVGESRSERSQHQNKRIALERLVKTKVFQLWHKKKAFEMMGIIKSPAEIEKEVDELLKPEYLKIEVR